MNYLKDRYSYIKAHGEPAIEHIPDKQENNIFSGLTVFPYQCHCGKTFRFYEEIRIHRRQAGHFQKHTINNINKE